MQITVEIPDHLALAAQARGLSLDRRLAELLAEELASASAKEPASATMLPAPMSPPRRLGRRNMSMFFEIMAAHSDEIPALPEEAFTRESFYQDHD